MLSKDLFIAALGLAVLSAQAGEPSETLRASDSRQGDIPAGSERRFTLQLERGGFAKLTVDQIDADLAVSVIGPDGKELDQFDSSAKGQPEPVEFEVPATGRYEIVIMGGLRLAETVEPPYQADLRSRSIRSAAPLRRCRRSASRQNRAKRPAHGLHRTRSCSKGPKRAMEWTT